MSKAISGFGVAYKIHDGLDPGDFTTMAEVIDIPSPPSDTVDDIEVTHHASPGRRKEFIAGLIDGGEVNFMINWVPGDTEDEFLQGLKTSGEKRDHKIVWPNDFAWTFEGYIKGLEPASAKDGQMTLSVTVKVTGATTQAADA